MTRLETPPGFFLNILTLGIARARWIADSNKRLGQGGAGFWFAWFLQAFANYGLAGRINNALAQTGSQHRESPLACFFLTGFPFVGAKKRLKRGTAALNNAYAVRLQQAPPVMPATPGVPPTTV